jgi:hypothetical protein
MKKDGFIYIGEYYHKHGKELSLTEKKLGKTRDLSDPSLAVSSEDLTIGYAIKQAYSVQDVDMTFDLITAFIDADRLTGEWFEDHNNTLKSRIEKFVVTMGGMKIDSDVLPL